MCIDWQVCLFLVFGVVRNVSQIECARRVYGVYIFMYQNRVNIEVNSSKIEKFDEFDRVNIR